MRGLTMRKGITVGLCSLAAAGAALGLITAGAGAQDSSGITIYRGGTAQEAGIKLVNWGSGNIAEESQLQYSGSRSLRLVTHGMHQGASLVLAKPIELAPYINNKNAYLQFIIQVPDNQSADGTGSPAGFSGSSPFGGGGPGRGAQGGFPGAPGGGGFPGLGGGFPGYGGGGRRGGTATSQKAQNIEKLRMVLVTTSDRTIEFLMPMEYARPAENQWKQLSIPVGAIPGLKADDAQIKEIRIFGDSPGTIYLGQLRVLTDITPLTLDRIGEKVIPRNARYTYTARASAGIIPLKVTWDFNEADGIQEEKEGRTVVHSYHKSGEYVGTVTVQDVYGMMEPKTVKFKILVTR